MTNRYRCTCEHCQMFTDEPATPRPPVVPVDRTGRGMPPLPATAESGSAGDGAISPPDTTNPRRTT